MGQRRRAASEGRSPCESHTPPERVAVSCPVGPPEEEIRIGVPGAVGPGEGA
jgi:hypothetical protein